MAGLPEELLPSPSKAKLQEAFLGKRLQDVPMPAAILDRAVVQRNCDHMLNACQSLGVDFRPHVKTHKVQLPSSDVLLLSYRSLYMCAREEYCSDEKLWMLGR